MNTRKIAIAFTLSTLTTCTLVSCTTTGDPNAGGLWGWSEDKAIERRNELQNQYTSSYNTLQGLERQLTTQNAEYQRLLQENKRLKKKRDSARTLQEKAEIEAAIRLNEDALRDM